MNEEKSYYQWLEVKQKETESLCLHCGACCGSDEDPCQQLMIKDGKYFCKVYNQRLGPQKTLKGIVFNCIPIRDKLATSWPGDEKCGYRKGYHD